MNLKPTHIVATIGPASETEAILKEMITHGLRVARFNFSHNTYAWHGKVMKRVKKVARKLHREVLVMQDLQGPKIRVKELKKPVKVTKGKVVTIGKDFDIDLPIFQHVRPGERILIQDGLIQLTVEKVVGETVLCKVLNSGVIQTHKGVNLPDTKLKLPSLTEKDIKDLAWGLRQGIDLVSVSFVRSKEDIAFVKKQIVKGLPKGFKKPKVVAKIEKPEAIKNISAIVTASDWIMVARGDLGVELPEEQVPLLQRKIITLSKKAKKPVIVATQMLESMVTNPRPTRAEVSDVADAVLEGTDYVMLSEESAFGKYPLEAVTEMQKIITYTLEHT